MRCPDCGHDNVEGSDECRSCGSSLSQFDPRGNEVEQSLEAHPIGVLVPREPVCVPPDMSVSDVASRMAEKNTGCALVVEHDRLLGVFSERDMLNKVIGETGALIRPVSEYMTASPVTVTRRDSIGYALQTMDLGGYRHLPIVDAANVPVGLLSTRDVLRFLCIKYADSRS